MANFLKVILLLAQYGVDEVANISMFSTSRKISDSEVVDVCVNKIKLNKLSGSLQYLQRYFE